MGRPLRFLPRPGTTFEITTRCVQARLLLRPSARLNELVLGVLGRALSRWSQVKLHLVVAASNHMHLLATVPDSDTLSAFMCFVNSNIARQAGRLHGWREKFWGRRYAALAVVDDAAMLERACYILSHGCKEDLVERPGDWPGVQCAEALVSGKKLCGIWHDRRRAARARGGREKGGGESRPARYEVALSPLPCWGGLSEGEQRERARVLLGEIEREHRERRERTGKKGVLGRRNVLRQDPHSMPREVKRLRAPACHSSEPGLRESFRQSYRAFLKAYREAAGVLRERKRLVAFPEHSFPPAPGYWTSSAAAAG